jgi:hypothetical protein
MKKQKKIATTLLVTMTMMFAFLTNPTIGESTTAKAYPTIVESKTAKAYVGIGYAAAVNGASAKKGAVIGVVGVAHAAWEGFIWGCMFGGGVGAIAGAVVGL